jgi:hypothetical protein
MGYRSDVTIIMYPSADHRDKFAALKLYVDENLPDEFEVIGEGDRRYLHCYIDGVKWYDSYEEVDAYSKLFSECEDVEYHQSYGADHVLNMSREVYIDR